MSPCNFGDEVLRQLQIPLGAHQIDMTEIRGQQRELGSEIDVLLVPQRQAQDRERMPDVMNAQASTATDARDASTSEKLMEGITKCASCVRSSTRMGKEGRGRVARGEMGLDGLSAMREVTDELRCHRDES
jgi:hypothetical protein